MAEATINATQNNTGGGGGSGAGVNAGPDLAAQLAAANARIAEFEAKSKPAPTTDDPTLADRARKSKESDDADKSKMKRLENALTFNLKSQDFLKSNEALLPKSVAEIFTQADKETYADAIEKDAAIRSGIVQSFFSVQENMDLLTPSLKASLDEYLKLTKTGKQDKALAVYESIFEPAFEMLKRVKKAEALGKGYGGTDDADTAYAKRMEALSKKHYGMEK